MSTYTDQVRSALATANSASGTKTATLSSKDKDKAYCSLCQDCRPRPNRLPPWEALRMATIEGAQAVGLQDEVGSLEAGKQADLMLVDLTELNLSPVLETPVREPTAGGPPNLVYAGSGHEVKTVMVAGKVLVRDGAVLIADEAAVREEAQVHAQEVARRVAADPVHKEMALLEAMEAGRL